MGQTDDNWLVSLGDGAATDEAIGQLQLDGLRTLWFTRSPVTDTALRHLATAPSLPGLHLRSTRITDDGLRQFLPGPPPPFLDLAFTDVGDEGLRHLAQIKELRYRGLTLDLRGSRVTVAGVAEFLRTFPKPESPNDLHIYMDDATVWRDRIWFRGSSVTDADLEPFRTVMSLCHVSLRETQVTDAGLEYLAELKDLESIDLRSSNVTEEGVKRLQARLPECRIQY